ncbi:TIGR03087 family PEP-CTERM/XrtA system glycosyltransferase [Ectothiorhodospira marina]|uniref:Sugar transferase, PEP-CTERM/EpsH1 system associated n=1 Tax=Ectothiorhodospira marina TaxID=1396821 RepID=A0A1H7IDJ5_9GAMM|nr:TIGR03087 family PEP-CTERM/XrtA system glycosyltransferase [Ectothiorhodospira marina]SEK60633.1 sugar transferase, PEP-CTERM/EpsH1 system associated [Ectothiorhodospira marina]
MTKPQLLFLAHRIPYPPNKGDKIRSFNLLKHLAGHYRIHLGCFVDDPADWCYQDDITAYCEDVHLQPLNPRMAKLKSLRGLLTGQALTVPYYADARMHEWVRKRLDSGIDRVLVFSSAMAQYLQPEDHARRHVVVDFVDVDSDKWRQYAPSHRFPMNQLYTRESHKLLAFERKVSSRATAGVFVSHEEAALFRQLSPETAQTTHAIDNGVDVDYFSPQHVYPSPYRAGERHLVFTGAMDYWANVDAVCWFAETIFPSIRERCPRARFTIVGARPTPEVKQLEQVDSVHVTGAVKDVRPYLAYAAAAVAPLRIARGVQNKVLEAMAMARPVIATSQAMDGLRVCPDVEPIVGDTSEALIELAVAALTGEIPEDTGARNRTCVCRHYSWAEHMGRFVDLLESERALTPTPLPQAGEGLNSSHSCGKSERRAQ